MLELGRQQVPCRVKSAGTRVKRVIFGLGEVGRPDQQGPRRIEASRSDISRKPLGATLFGLGRLHRLDEQRVDERGSGEVWQQRTPGPAGVKSESQWLFPGFYWEYRERSEALPQGGCGVRTKRRAATALPGPA